MLISGTVFTECIQTAADLASRMDTDVDPCEDFYQFACGGYIKNVSDNRGKDTIF